MLLGKAAELSGWGPEGALDPGRVGTIPGPPFLSRCLTQVTPVCLETGLHVGSFQQRCAKLVSPDEGGAEGWACRVGPWRMTVAMASGAGLDSDTAGRSAFPCMCSLCRSTVFKAHTRVGVWSCPWNNRGTLCRHVFQHVTLGWLLAFWPALHLSCGQRFLSLGCFLSGRICGNHV